MRGRLSTSQGEASLGKAARTDKEVQRRDVDGEVDEGRYTTLYKVDTEEWSAALLLDLGRGRGRGSGGGQQLALAERQGRVCYAFLRLKLQRSKVSRSEGDVVVTNRLMIWTRREVCCSERKGKYRTYTGRGGSR